MEDIINAVRADAVPDQAERDELQEAAEMLRSEIRDELTARGHDNVNITQTGSTARGTWVSGDRDIDMFLEFPTETSDAELEEQGLAIGEAVVPNAQRDYAAHPYTKGTFKGFEVDVVPCFNVYSASAIQSAVDRTPFHTRYLEPRLSGDIADDVILTKKFMKGTGVYGSDVKTGGFSGYLTELLVLEYGGFVPLLEAAADDWGELNRLDPESHAEASFPNDPMVVIDPADPERNVAAALSEQTFSEFIHNARRFLEEPSETYFTTGKTKSIRAEELQQMFDQRGTVPVAVTVPINESDIVVDTLYPQSVKSHTSIHDSIENRDFSVVASYPLVTEDSVGFLFELESEVLPNVTTRRGPPVTLREPSERFVRTHEQNPNSGQPAIVDGRFTVDVEREFVNAVEYLDSNAIQDELALGPAVEQNWEDKTVHAPENVASLAENFGDELADTRLAHD